MKEFDHLALQEQLMEQLHRVMRFLRRGADGAAHRGGRLLRTLEPLEQRGEMATRELAEVLDVRPSSLNEMLSRLEQDGMVVRRRDQQDQRVFLVQLTARGGECLKALRAALREKEDWLSEILNREEAEQLLALCRKLSDGLEARAPRDRDMHGRGHGEHGRGGHGWM